MYSPWGVEIRPYSELKKKKLEFIQRRQQIDKPYANRIHIPKTIPRRRRSRNLNTFTPNRKPFSKPRNINVPVSAIKHSTLRRGTVTPLTPTSKVISQKFNFKISWNTETGERLVQTTQEAVKEVAENLTPKKGFKITYSLHHPRTN